MTLDRPNIKKQPNNNNNNNNNNKKLSYGVSTNKKL